MLLSLRHAVVVFLFVVGCAAIGSTGRAADPEFLQHTPADRDVVLYVADVLPHLERVLTSERFLELADNIIASVPTRGPRSDPAQWLSTVRLQGAPFIPTEVALSMNQKSLSQFARVMRMGLQIGLCNGAIKAEQTDDLVKVQRQMLKDVQEFRLTGTDLWLNFRNPAPAAIVFGQVSQLANQWEASGAVEVERGDNEVRFRASLGDVVDTETMPFYLLGLGIVEEFESAMAEQLSHELARLSLDVRLRMVGNALQLSLDADSDATQTLTTESLGELWRSDPSTMMFTMYRSETFRDEVLQLQQTSEEWQNTATGKAAAELDDEDLLGDLQEIARWLKQGSSRGTMRMSWDDQIQIVWHEYDMMPVKALADSPIVAFIPKSPGIIVATSTGTIADLLADQMAGFEDRLARNSLKYELSGRTMQAEMTERLTQFYYGHMNQFRKLVKEESFRTFESPAVVVVNGKGKIDELTATFSVDNNQNRLVGKDIRCSQMAVIGRVKQGADAGAFAKSAWRAFVEGLSENTVTLDAVIGEANYGLGVPTFAFAGDWQKQLAYDLKIQCDGGLEPHYFSPQPDWFVFSTSPELSRSIITAGRTAEARWTLPASSDAGEMVSFGEIPGNVMASLISVLPETYDLFLADNDRVQLTGGALLSIHAMAKDQRAEMQPVVSLLNVTVEACQAMQSFQWSTHQTGPKRTTKASIVFASE